MYCPSTQDWGGEAMVQAGERSRKDAEGSIAESKLYEADRCTVREDELRCGKGDEAQKYGTMGWPPLEAEHRRCFKARGSFLGSEKDHHLSRNGR